MSYPSTYARRSAYGRRPWFLRMLRPRLRSLATVCLLVVIPWVLVAVPGTLRGGGMGDDSYKHFTHGWPFIHLDRTTVDRLGPSGDLAMSPNVSTGPPVPSSLSDEKFRETAFSFHPTKVDGLQLVLRLNRQVLDLDAEGIQQLDAFWTSRERWPIRNHHSYMTIRRKGLAANLIFLLTAVLLVLTLAEYRINTRGRLLTASPLGILVFLMAIGGAAAWMFVASNEQRQIQSRLADILDLSAGEEVNVELIRTTQFPIVVSQLFNHGNTPFGALDCFTRVESGRISLKLGQLVGSQTRQPDFSKTLAASPLPMDVEIEQYDSEAEAILHSLAKDRIESLCIHFSMHAWVQEVQGQAGAEVAPLNLPVRLSKLKVLRLYLDEELDQIEQLRSFSGLAIRHLRIDGLSPVGATYLIENRHYWPLRLSVSFTDDVSPQLRDKFQGTFSVHQTWPDELPFGPVL